MQTSIKTEIHLYFVVSLSCYNLKFDLGSNFWSLEFASRLLLISFSILTLWSPSISANFMKKIKLLKQRWSFWSIHELMPKSWDVIVHLLDLMIDQLEVLSFLLLELFYCTVSHILRFHFPFSGENCGCSLD